MTAYGIEFLTEAGRYVNVDRNRTEEAVGWLLNTQQADGSWKPHYGDTTAGLNLYIAEVLARTIARDDFSKSVSKDLHDRVNGAVKKALEWAATSATAVHDPYANALRLRLTNEATTAVQLHAELTQTAVHDRDGAHWTRATYSPFYGWGHAGDLETTALVLRALGQSASLAVNRSLENDALFYLLRNKDRYGIWFSGQATVRILQALLPMAAEQMTAPRGFQEFRLAVNRTPLSGKDAEALKADPRMLEPPRSLDLTALLKPGHSELDFSNASDTALASAEISVSFYSPWKQDVTNAQSSTQTGKDYGLDFGYKCEADGAKVGQPINCNVGVRRFGSSGYGMLLAEVGLPPGADVDRASLARLLDNWTISRYELQPDRIVFYLWSWKAEGSHLSFSFMPRYGIHAKTAPATLSDYYNPDLKVALAPQTFTVLNQPRK